MKGCRLSPRLLPPISPTKHTLTKPCGIPGVPQNIPGVPQYLVGKLL